MRSEVFQIKQLADLLPCAGGNHQTGGYRECLQARRKVWRLADDRLFLRRARADQIPCVRLGKYRRFREDAIETWINSNVVPGMTETLRVPSVRLASAPASSRG